MKLCLITCNIRFDNPADGDNSWSRRRSLLAQTLLKHSPDVIATQEGRYAQLADLASLLPDFELVDFHRSWIKERMYPSFFVRKKRFEVIQSEDLWLSETPDVAGSLSFGSAFPRLMTWLRLQPVGSERKLLLVNTHLDHIKPETRKGQIRVLTKEVRRAWQDSSSLVIMGDFNDSPESEVRKIIEGEFTGIQDAWKMFNDREEPTHHAFAGEVQNSSRIDWILVDQSLAVSSCLIDKSTLDGRWPTDHFPVVCEVTL